jgi:hypothetical protein
MSTIGMRSNLRARTGYPCATLFDEPLDQLRERKVAMKDEVEQNGKIRPAHHGSIRPLQRHPARGEGAAPAPQICEEDGGRVADRIVQRGDQSLRPARLIGQRLQYILLEAGDLPNRRDQSRGQ